MMNDIQKANLRSKMSNAHKLAKMINEKVGCYMISLKISLKFLNSERAKNMRFFFVKTCANAIFNGNPNNFSEEQLMNFDDLFTHAMHITNKSLTQVNLIVSDRIISEIKLGIPYVSGEDYVWVQNKMMGQNIYKYIAGIPSWKIDDDINSISVPSNIVMDFFESSEIVRETAKALKIKINIDTDAILKSSDEKVRNATFTEEGRSEGDINDFLSEADDLYVWCPKSVYREDKLTF